MTPAPEAAAAFYAEHMPDGIGNLAERGAIRDALAALVAAERAAVREACAAGIDAEVARQLPSLTDPGNSEGARGMAANVISGLRHAAKLTRALPLD